MHIFDFLVHKYQGFSHEEMEADHAVGLLEKYPTMAEIERLQSELNHMKEKYNQEVPDFKAEVDMKKRRLKEKEQQSPLTYDAVLGMQENLSTLQA